MEIWGRLQKILLGMLILCGSATILGVCNCKDNEHRDATVTRCWYTQKDLKRIYAKDSDRYNKMGIDKTRCFYCGCDASEHTEE